MSSQPSKGPYPPTSNTTNPSASSNTAPTPTTAQKPTLAGAKSKQRKGVAKSQAKFEPAPFRDQLVRALDTVPSGDFDGYYTKLDQLANQLDFRKYDTQLFEVLLVGGLLAPGGTYVDDASPRSPFSILSARSATDLEEMKRHVSVFTRLMRKLKFLQKTFEDTTLKNIISYRWPKEDADKLAVASALFVIAGLCNASVLSGLTKDHLVKDGTSVQFMTLYLRTYLSEPSTTDSSLLSSLRSAKMLDLESLWPITKRSPSVVTAHFTQAGLPRVVEIYRKVRVERQKEELKSGLRDLVNGEESNEVIVTYLQDRRTEDTALIPPADYIDLLWKSVMSKLDLTTRADLIKGLTEKHVREASAVLEPFVQGAAVELALIYAIQEWCYENTKLLPVFGAVLEVLYDQDVLSSGAIQYWYTKGRATQGRVQFLKFTEQLYKRLQAEEEEEEEDDEE